jgi:hypothetical protein
MSAQRTIPPDRAAALAAEAYIFGQPLVLVDATRRQALRPAGRAAGATVNRFDHLRAFPDASFTDIVTPNADTLYSVAWLDLSAGPVLLGVPEMGERYYLMQLMDAWTNVIAAPGSRTTGQGAGQFAIVWPGAAGGLPGGVQTIASPTQTVWLLGRTRTDGKGDYRAVHALQDRYTLAPLGAHREVPPVVSPGDKAPPADQVLRMEPAEFFGRLNALMQENAPAPADAPVLERLAAIGVGPGLAFDPSRFDRTTVTAITRGVQQARQQILTAAGAQHGRRINGWDIMPNLGRYGTEYLWRAVVATVGLGANLAEDAIYPRAVVDGQGRALDGANRYQIRFAAGALPPVRGFWSVTLYDARQAFAANPLHRHALGDRDPLRRSGDGSLTLYVQAESPGADRENNWLPAPRGPFNLVMRLYWPDRPILDGAWTVPPIERLA